MAKNLKRITMILCLLALCVGMMSVAASAAYAPVTAVIPVDVTLTGTLPDAPDTFQVELTADKAGNPMPADAVDGVFIMDMAGASSDVLQISFDELGVYSYTVRQLPLGNADCYQDSSTYKITAYVTNNDAYDAFSLNVVVYREGETQKRDDILFANRYANPAVAQIMASKTMDGKTPADGAFRFELVDATGSVVQTVTNKGGAVAFAPIQCDQVGSTAYTLREVAGSDANIIYDTKAYTATVDVVKDSNGDYQATVSYKLGDQAVSGVPTFANKTKPPVPVTGDDANLLLWGGMMIAAMAAVVVLLPVAKRKKQA